MSREKRAEWFEELSKDTTVNENERNMAVQMMTDIRAKLSAK